MEQHWDALAYDGIALVTTVTSVIAIASLVAIVFFQAYAIIKPLFLFLFVPILIESVANDVPIESFFLTYNYAKQPTCFESFLSDEQKPIYNVYYMYNIIGKAGAVVNQPLSPQEISDLDKIVKRREDVPLFQVISIYRYLLETNKIQPTHQARIQAFVDSEPQVRNALDIAINAHNDILDADARLAAINNDFAARIQQIMLMRGCLQH
jgi:hypothetical protein